MKYSDLISISMNNYRKNGFISHVLFFFIMLLACAFLLLGLLLADLIIFLIPFLFIPCFFAVHFNSVPFHSMFLCGSDRRDSFKRTRND